LFAFGGEVRRTAARPAWPSPGRDCRADIETPVRPAGDVFFRFRGRGAPNRGSSGGGRPSRSPGRDGCAEVGTPVRPAGEFVFVFAEARCAEVKTPVRPAPARGANVLHRFEGKAIFQFHSEQRPRFIRHVSLSVREARRIEATTNPGASPT
jgi:hypothetical protein